MNLLPCLHVTPQVKRDITACLSLGDGPSWRQYRERVFGIDLAVLRAVLLPEQNHPHVSRPKTGLELRRCNAGQFVVVYAYFPPTENHPRGVVSIRAVRYSRARDLSAGVVSGAARLPIRW